MRKLRSIATYLSRIAAAAYSWQPLTLRGIAALILAIFALRYLAFSEHDLAANLVGVTTCGVIAAFALIALLLRIVLQRRITARCRFDEIHAYSRTNVPSGIVLENCSILSFFELDAARKFARGGVDSPHHVVKGSDGPARRRYLIDAVRFPHRGLWKMEALDFSLSDIAGLVRIGWRLPVESSVEVSAATISIRPLPIMVSSARAGDEISHSQERSGDPFDMKTYDPSDGVKRIMWKVYARSQQLVVRRPEPAVIPEGELALYLVAGRDEDYVAGALQGYLDQLEEEQITVLFGTDGLATAESATALGASVPQPSQHYCTGLDSIRKAIIHSVWSEAAGTGAGFAAFLGGLAAANKPVRRVVVFGPTRSKWLEHIAAAAGQTTTAVTAVVVPDEFRKILGRLASPEDSSGEFLSRLRPSDSNVAAIRRLIKRLSGGPAELAGVSIEAVAARNRIELIRCERR